jgi:hypothetical protein
MACIIAFFGGFVAQKMMVVSCRLFFFFYLKGKQWHIATIISFYGYSFA